MGGGTFYEGIILALLSGLLELARPRLHFLEGGTLKLLVTKRLWLGLFMLILFSHSSGVLRPFFINRLRLGHDRSGKGTKDRRCERWTKVLCEYLLGSILDCRVACRTRAWLPSHWQEEL